MLLKFMHSGEALSFGTPDPIAISANHRKQQSIPTFYAPFLVSCDHSQVVFRYKSQQIWLDMQSILTQTIHAKEHIQILILMTEISQNLPLKTNRSLIEFHYIAVLNRTRYGPALALELELLADKRCPKNIWIAIAWLPTSMRILTFYTTMVKSKISQCPDRVD